MNAQEVTIMLGGRWHGGYGIIRCPAHEDRNPSCQISDNADGSLWATCHAGCPSKDVKAALRNRGLAGGGKPLSEEEIARRRGWDDVYRERRAHVARTLWADAECVFGTPAAAYLRHRGIPLGDLPDLLPNLRYHPACLHGPSGKRLPAMVARVVGGDTFAVHRTYLTPDGHKVDVAPARLALGAVRGGAVRLLGGAGRCLGGHTRLVVAEGIETALSLPCGLLPGPLSVWAALSAGGMAALRLPKPPRGGELIIAADGDKAGRDAATTLALRAAGEGWTVKMAGAPEGKDWNDVLLARGRVGA